MIFTQQLLSLRKCPLGQGSDSSVLNLSALKEEHSLRLICSWMVNLWHFKVHCAFSSWSLRITNLPHFVVSSLSFAFMRLCIFSNGWNNKIKIPPAKQNTHSFYKTCWSNIWASLLLDHVTARRFPPFPEVLQSVEINCSHLDLVRLALLSFAWHQSKSGSHWTEI